MKTQREIRAEKRRQKRQLTSLVLVLLGGLLVVAVGALWIKGGATSKAPLEVSGSARLKVDQEKVDLGDVRLGVPVKVSFKLTNVGDQPLKLTKTPYIEVAAGC